ncbi:MAG: hypothetical protein ACOZQL_38610 [Myxococcota bacterium]
MRNLILSSLLFFAVAGCTHQEPKPTVVSAPLPAEGKRSAPVAVDAAFTDQHAKLTLRFETAGENVAIGVSGLDGLTITSAPSLLAEGKIAAGEVRTFEVAFTRGPGRTTLGVEVRGTFNGAPLGRVVTFSLGEGPLPQSGTKVITDDGDAIKLMK